MTTQEHEPLSMTGGGVEASEEEPSPSLVELIGAEVVGLVRVGFELYSLFVRTLYYCVRGRREPGAVMRQMFEIGNRSVFFLTVVMGFIGMILVLQGGLQVKRILPDFSRVGATFLDMLVRDLAASIGSLMLATRVGAGIAAEIGSMVVTEQIDALRMSAADPIDYLIKPRFIASLVMTTCLVVWSAAVATLTGMLTAYVTFDVNPRTFFNLVMVNEGDLITGLAKCLAYGAAIPIIAGHSGLMTHGGSEGVGWATTRAVINGSLAVILLDLVISTAGYLVFGP
ncbi:MlaE family ABC transporter permease [Polyangium aurulentum]|uniref:MlaE family ABC transporter permease n=1 Tax=Polyangium aurulentum TaxID=2567896 RepID=UPI0010ADBAA2|nr:ABC transporter permease [Polyangium aurulentum]UQA56261.1 ABC transporter permease [Polyangium aurulentum]